MTDAVLLVAFGGPTAPDEVRPFLDNVARGRAIPPERLALVARQYETIGGRSPLKDLTLAQAQALAGALAAAGHAVPVHVGMRNWHPYLHETLATLAATGARRVTAVILSPFRSEPSWDRYMEDVRAAGAPLATAPEVVFAPPWARHRRHVGAVADRARAALTRVPAPERPWTPLVFTAHSLPVRTAESSPYVTDFFDTAHAVVDRLEHSRFSIAYQSRSGHPRDAWLEPDINDVLKGLAADGEKHAVIVPLGFVVDHVEVLYDLDVLARETAAAAGITVHRAETVGDHPEFIAALADSVLGVA